MKYPAIEDKITETKESRNPPAKPRIVPFRYITILEGTGKTISETRIMKLKTAYLEGLFCERFNKSSKNGSTFPNNKKSKIIKKQVTANGIRIFLKIINSKSVNSNQFVNHN